MLQSVELQSGKSFSGMIPSPGLKKMWCIPKVTAEFKKRMLEVLKVYEREYDPLKPVVCLDEKSYQLLGETRVGIPMQPRNKTKHGKPTRLDYEYKRNGTCNLFVAVEPKGKRRTVRVTKRRTKKDYASFVKH